MGWLAFTTDSWTLDGRSPLCPGAGVFSTAVSVVPLVARLRGHTDTRTYGLTPGRYMRHSAPGRSPSFRHSLRHSAFWTFTVVLQSIFGFAVEGVLCRAACVRNTPAVSLAASDIRGIAERKTAFDVADAHRGAEEPSARALPARTRRQAFSGGAAAGGAGCGWLPKGDVVHPIKPGGLYTGRTGLDMVGLPGFKTRGAVFFGRRAASSLKSICRQDGDFVPFRFWACLYYGTFLLPGTYPPWRVACCPSCLSLPGWACMRQLCHETEAERPGRT